MKTAELAKKETITFRERSIPTPQENELLIQVEYVGICGSDVHLYQTATCCGKDVTEPCVLGHEAAGVVVGMGSAVQYFKIGDRIAVEPQKPCMKCAYCKSGS